MEGRSLPPLEPHKPYTTREVAPYVGYSPRTMERWRTTGVGPPFRRINNHGVRYLGEEVLAWMDDQTRDKP